MEVWKDVKGYENYYEVSNHGGIRSKDRTIKDSLGIDRHKKGRVLKNRTQDKYYMVMLCKGGGRKTVYVHCLVADAFIKRVPGKPFVNHKDGNKLNNHYKNLEWCTAAENNRHAVKTGLNDTRHKVILIHKDTGERKAFDSKTAASEYLGHRHNYITGIVKSGKMAKGKYIIEVQPLQTV